MDGALKVKGAFRLQVVNEDGTIASDSGWHENQITNDGLRLSLINCFAGLANSSQVTYIALGTGTVPGAAATSLNGEVTSRCQLTASSSGSTAVNFFANFSSSSSFVGAQVTLTNIGLFCTSTAGAGTLVAGKTYAGQTCNTNQNVNTTYSLSWTTS